MSRLPSDVPFTIGVISKITGIAPDTLRVWEKRYGFPRPKRLGKGVRVYSKQDVDKLRLAAALLEVGYRPGDVMDRSIDELQVLVDSSGGKKTTPRSNSHQGAIERTLQAILRYDVTSAAETLSAEREALGLVRFVREFARPLMERVGLMWSEDGLQIRHEHLISELLETELRLAMAKHRVNDGPRVLLATLPGEQHGLGLDLWAADLVGKGANPYILGIDLPLEQISKTAAAVDARIVAIFVSGALDSAKCSTMVSELLEQLPRRVHVWLGGFGTQQLQALQAGARVFDSYVRYDQALDELFTEARSASNP